MKKIFFIIVFVTQCLVLFGSPEKIVIHDPNEQPDHIEYYPPADMPEVYFDTDNLEIIIVADGFATYYDVEIVSLGSMLTVISTQIDGYGDSIDVSSLAIGDYRIVITSSNNNVFEGDFIKQQKQQ